MIENQTGYVFYCDESILENVKNVTVNIKNEDIEDAVQSCLEGQGLDFSITDKAITIVNRKKFRQIKASKSIFKNR